jgi:hypothetical protein
MPGRANKRETMGGMNSLIVRLWPVILHSTASHVATIIKIWPMRCISIVTSGISGNSDKAVAVVVMKRKASANVKDWTSGPGRQLNQRHGTCTGQRQLNTDIHLHPINSGPRSLTPPQPHHARASSPLNRSFTCSRRTL